MSSAWRVSRRFFELSGWLRLLKLPKPHLLHPLKEEALATLFAGKREFCRPQPVHHATSPDGEAGKETGHEALLQEASVEVSCRCWCLVLKQPL